MEPLDMVSPEVAVIAPTLNALSNIDNPLRTVMDEAGAVIRPVEILDIDGGSHGGTLDRVAKQSQLGILHRNSRDLTETRNEEVAKIQCIIGFCNSNDVSIELSLAKKREIMTSCPQRWAVSGS